MSASTWRKEIAWPRLDDGLDPAGCCLDLPRHVILVRDRRFDERVGL